MTRRAIVVVVAVAAAVLLGVGGFAVGQSLSIWQTGGVVHGAPLSQIPNDWYKLNGAKFDHALTANYQGVPVVILLNSYTGDVWVYQFGSVPVPVACPGNAPMPGWVCVNGGWRPAY